jgi:hypothetical protein
MKKFLSLLAFLFFTTTGLQAFDFLSFFLHSETAGKNSFFGDVGISPFVFGEYEFPIIPLDIRVDYMAPWPLPISVGFFFKTPMPNLKHFGPRIAYHFNFLKRTDLYIAYVFDFGFVRNNTLEKYNDTPVPVHYYDFRVGARYFFRKRFGVAVETGFKFESLIFLITIKIN